MKTTFRYSEINTAYTCLHKYKLTALDKIQAPTDSGDMEFGTAIHTALHAHFEGEPWEPVFRMYWDSVKEKDLRYTRNKWEDLRDKGITMLSRWERLHAKHYRPLYVETRSEIMLAGMRVQGTPDFIGYYKDIPCILDFKTSGYEYDKRKIEVNEQMYIYAKMAKDVHNFDAKQLVYTVFIKNPEPRIQTISFDLTQEKTNSMLENVGMMMRDLSTRTEFPKNRNSCLNCEFFSHCYKSDSKE